MSSETIMQCCFLLPFIVGVALSFTKLRNKALFLITLATGIASGIIMQVVSTPHAHMPGSGIIFLILGLIVGLLVGTTAVVVRLIIRKIKK